MSLKEKLVVVILTDAQGILTHKTQILMSVTEVGDREVVGGQVVGKAQMCWRRLIQLRSAKNIKRNRKNIGESIELIVTNSIIRKPLKTIVFLF